MSLVTVTPSPSTVPCHHRHGATEARLARGDVSITARTSSERRISRLKGLVAEVEAPSVASKQTVLLQCLDAAGRAAAADDGWVSARAVARRLSPTADPESIGHELTRLSRLGLVEMWFKGGHSYYRRSP